jgi:adenosylcobinamide kinase/adenosylcobinamide-phosphate guanylyltransferase
VTQRGLTLVLGGARAGKTAFAERLAARHGEDVCYVATAEAHDDEMRARIAAHQAARSPTWRTLEAPLDVTAALRAVPLPGAVLLDCLTVWTSNILLTRVDPGRVEQGTARQAEAAAATAVSSLLRWQAETHVPLYVVSNEVGLGVVPPYSLGRLFQDVLGRLNQQVAAVAEEVFLVVAGLVLPLKALGATNIDAPPGLPLD